MSWVWQWRKHKVRHRLHLRKVMQYNRAVKRRPLKDEVTWARREFLGALNRVREELGQDRRTNAEHGG